MRLLLVRHGESTWNAEGRYQGRKDPPLSERGVLQARALAEHLANHDGVRPGGIVSSPLARARRTAEIVGERIHMRVETDDRLIEISHGAWEGLLISEVERRWPSMMAAWKELPDSVTFPGGESLSDVNARWTSFLSDVDRQPTPVLIVTHDVIVRLAVFAARGQALSAFNTFASENAALSVIDGPATAQRLVALNERAYLGLVRADPTTQAL